MFAESLRNVVDVFHWAFAPKITWDVALIPVDDSERVTVRTWLGFEAPPEG